MQRNKLILFIAVLFIILSVGVSQAITVTATPKPERVNQNVTVNINATFPIGIPPSCTIQANFGDGSPWVDAGTCTISPCNLTTNHTYTTIGTYTITARSKIGSCTIPPNAPNPATTSITVQCVSLSITSLSTLPTGTTGQAYTYQVQTSGGQPPVTYSLVSGFLPPGLTLSSTGLISGTTTTAGSYSFTIRATDSCPVGAQSAQRTFYLTMNPPPCPVLNITSPSTLSSGTVRQGYSNQILTSGGQAPITYSLVSGTMPPGLSLSPTGLISGTTTTAGSYNFTIRATDSCPVGAQTTQKTFSLTVNPAPVTVSVNVTPSSFRIPRGTSSTQNLFYSFSTTPAVDATLSSNQGVFRAGSNVIGQANTPLNVSITNGTGRVSEMLNIPVSIVKRAERLGTPRITYVRTFTDTTVSVTAQVDIIVTTEAGAEFRITRLQLYFENKRAEITVKRNQPSLKAYADIRFVGSGLLQGFWEVDGRILSNVYRHFVYGRTITIETPDIPPLPTFETGTHRVRLVITDPSQDIPFPEAIYFVTTEEYQKMFPINLVHPQDNAEIDYSPVTFKWEGKNQTVTYLIEFLEKGGEKPVFSAYTKKADYKLPLPVLKGIFAPGKSYLWSVKGFDTNNNITGDSQVFRFTFKELTSYLSGQIVLATEGSQKGTVLIDKIVKTYNLSLIDKFDIKSLNLKVAVLYTEEEILKLINAIGKEDGVILAQPNYIFRTMSEPMSDMQNIYKVLNFQKLHKHSKGKGVVVAVVDTGVDIDHRDLKDRIVSSENLLKDYAYRPEVHGTAVAGVIGASINEFGINGVAPESEILALRACRQVSETRPEGECHTTSITKAIDIAIDKKARIVNMSFGSTAPDNLLIRLIEEGAKMGIIFVAPVGNMPRQKDLTFPASHPDVIAVGGIDDKGNPYPNPEIASKARVSAPATNVFTTIPRNRHNFLSGTSMSSATVAGILALAIGKDGGVEKDKIPSFNGDICRWVEELLNISICNK